MRNLLIIVCFLVSCNKQQTREVEGITFRITSKSIFFPKAYITAEPFCKKMLYTINSQIDSSERIMISVVTDKLEPGNYEAGISHWGNPTISDNVTLNVLSFSDGVLNATFAGTISSGIIKNIHN